MSNFSLNSRTTGQALKERIRRISQWWGLPCLSLVAGASLLGLVVLEASKEVVVVAPGILTALGLILGVLCVGGLNWSPWMESKLPAEPAKSKIGQTFQKRLRRIEEKWWGLPYGQVAALQVAIMTLGVELCAPIPFDRTAPIHLITTLVGASCLGTCLGTRSAAKKAESKEAQAK